MTVAKVEKATPTTAEVETIVTGKPADYAETLDREIRAGFSVVLESQHRLAQMVEEAKNARIHKTLINPETGKAYRSWVEYMGNVISGLELDVKSLSARDKAFLVVMLFNTGMSQRVIAEALSIGVGTANRAIQAGREAGTVKKDRDTTSKDGRTFKGAGDGAAKGKGPKVEKTALDRAQIHLRAVARLVEEMDAEQVAGLKKALASVGREVTKAAKAKA